MDEKTSPLNRGVRWLKDLYLTSKGMKIGDARLYGKRDASNNFDPYWKRKDGTDVNMTGEVLLVRATSNLVLTTTLQSIVATGGDSNKLRILLPTIGEWLVTAVVNFAISVVDPDMCYAQLFVADSGTPEDGDVNLGETGGAGHVQRGTPGQQWKITTTSANTAIELKARKTTDAGTAYAVTEHTTLSATIGAGGGSSVEAVDHGTLTGRGDDDHNQYGQLADPETVSGAWTFSGAGEITLADGKSINLQEALTFTGATTENIVEFPDNLADALSFEEGTSHTAYMTFVSTDAGEKVTFGKSIDVTGNIVVSGTVDGVDVSAHDVATTGVHGAGANTLLHSASTVSALTTVGALASGSLAAGFDVVTAPLGGTGVASPTDHSILLGSGAAAVTPMSVLTKGQLLVGQTAADPTALVIGADTHVLTLDSAEGAGVKWAAAAGGGAVATDVIWAAAGDLVKGTGDDTADILSIGAAHSVLQTLDGAALSWQTAPELQYVKDITGVLRITTAAAAPNVKLGGEVWVWGERMRVSNLSGPSGNTVFEASARTTTYGAAAEVNIIKASHVGTGVGVSGMGATVRGVFGLPVVAFANGSSFGLVYGLHFMPYVRGTASVYELGGIKTGYGANTFIGTITDARGIDVDPPSHTGSGHTITTSTGIRVGNHGNSARIADAYGVKIEDMTTNTGFQRLLEISSATAAHPYLRVVGGGDPAANQTNLYVKEQATMRHVQWMDPGAGGANFAGGERVMILV